jgi:phospholipid/cholesterol/gamma-HCH transport system substrate-binding protein
MKNNYAAIGTFVLVAIVLFSIGLFLIGDRQKAFSHHTDYYTELADVNGLATGSKVRVDGYDAGQVEKLQIPDRPSGKFRLKLRIDDKLRNLIRTDSLVSVESDGLVGDKFILIHNGSDAQPEAADGSTLAGKEPIEISAVIAKATGIMDQASATIGDMKGRLDVALDTVTGTVKNANGLVDDARHGKGPVGELLNDQQTADQIKQTVANVTQASDHINQMSLQAGQLVSDLQSRNLPAKIDDTVNHARSASQQLDQASKQVNSTLSDALGPDSTGVTAGENIRESLANVNLATANVADDTEALKHGFFFRGYFKKRGFYSLQDLAPEQYRTNAYFQSPANHRAWLDAIAFTTDASGKTVLSPAGQQQIDDAVGSLKNIILDHPLVIEGYSTDEPPAQQIIESRSHSLLVAHYLENASISERRTLASCHSIARLLLLQESQPGTAHALWFLQTGSEIAQQQQAASGLRSRNGRNLAHRLEHFCSCSPGPQSYGCFLQ